MPKPKRNAFHYVRKPVLRSSVGIGGGARSKRFLFLVVKDLTVVAAIIAVS